MGSLTKGKHMLQIGDVRFNETEVRSYEPSSIRDQDSRAMKAVVLVHLKSGNCLVCDTGSQQQMLSFLDSFFKVKKMEEVKP
jgi:hypothetical protein